MAEYKFTVDDFLLTTTWKRMVQSAGIVNYDIVPGAATKNFSINGISLSEGESIQYVTLTADLSRSGTVDSSALMQVNGVTFVGSRKFSADGIANNTTWQANFVLRASGTAGLAGALNQAVSHSYTVSFSNVTLTIFTGTGNVFDGKVSSLNEGDKILIEESDDSEALYTLVHHEYNTGKALIFRDASYGTSAYRSADSYDGYNGSKLDTYLTDTFYAALPSTTTRFLQTIDYPIKEKAYNSSDITITRTAATISGRETGLGGVASYGNVLNYTDTIGIGEYYWTREPVSGMNTHAHCVSFNNQLYNQPLASELGVRPTLGVLEEQLVRQIDDAYVFCSQCVAPSTLYINGSESNVVDLNKEANLTLSWSAGTAGYNAPISGYAVWYSTSANGEYELYGTTTDTSMTIVGPAKTRQVYYFKVQTLGPEDADYCNSDLSSTYRSAATKISKVSYYDGARWILATVKYYNGSSWVEVNDTKYYNGSKWI